MYGLKAPTDGAVTVQYHSNVGSERPCSTLVTTPRSRVLHVCGVADGRGTIGDVGLRCSRVLESAGAIIRYHGFVPHDIVRTWCYMANIGRHYALSTTRGDSSLRRTGSISTAILTTSPRARGLVADLTRTL